jgi:hypothetical protein
VNGYVAGGWGAAAFVLILYSWRTLRRGRILARSLQGEITARSQPAGTPSEKTLRENTWR